MSVSRNEISTTPHTSTLLRQMIAQVPEKTFTLEWLVGRLPSRSFGVILLFLTLIAVLPVVSIPARVLILVLTFQIIAGYRAPVLPQRWMTKPLPSRRLVRLKLHVIPVLEKLESVVRPRFCSMMTTIRRPAAGLAFLLTLASLLAPLPLANVPPALICAMMALAYIEHDGLLFLVAIALALATITATVFLVWVI